VLTVHTHQEFITFKIEILKDEFHKRVVVVPHEAWKAINWDEFTRHWNKLVYTQPHTLTDSNQRLYYKLPQQLKAHHKNTILWKSECATLSEGSNFLARKPLLDILNSTDSQIAALPPNSLPDGELDTPG
jgi:hypothetical protein